MSDEFCESTGTTANTRKHIKRALRERLKAEYGSSKTNEFLKIQGFDDSRFDYVTAMNQMMYADLTTDGIDSNANKTGRSFSRVQAEVDNAQHKLQGHDALYRQLKQNVGRDEATRLTAEMYDYTLGINDATKLLIPYCFCISGMNLVLEGRDGMPKCAPPKHLHSYVSMLAGTIHELSNGGVCGAIAVGTFFFDCARVLMMDGFTLEDVRSDITKRKYIEQMFQQFVFDVNDKSRVGNESPFTNLSVFGRYKMMGLLEDMDWYFEETERDMEYVADFVSEIQEIMLDFMDKGDPLTGLPFTFPVITVCMTKDDNNELMDQEFIKKLCKRPVHRYNLFVSKGMKAASCCRLLSDSEMMDVASSANSFGGGGALSIGSHRVVCINLPRIALLSKSMEDFYNRLENLVKDSVTILKAHKDMLKKLEKLGMEPHLTSGLIKMERLFSTVGILGMWEMFKTLEGKFGESKSRDVEVMSFFNEKCLECGKQSGLIVNIEAIPGESMAVRFAKADRLLFGEKAVPYYIYSNQTVPLTEKIDVFDRMDKDGRINLLLTGGGIVHLTIGERVTQEQAEYLIKYAVKSNCEHFALNLVHSECEDGHICEGKYEVCPTCGKPITDYALRIVGFLRKVSSWSKERQQEFKERYIISNDKFVKN